MRLRMHADQAARPAETSPGIEPGVGLLRVCDGAVGPETPPASLEPAGPTPIEEVHTMRLLGLSSVLAVSVLAVGVVTAAPAAAAGPAVTLTPSSLTFADQAIGTTSVAQSVTVAN